MKGLPLTTETAILLEEIITFWIEDYRTTGTKHSMMFDALNLQRQVKALTKESK